MPWGHGTMGCGLSGDSMTRALRQLTMVVDGLTGSARGCTFTTADARPSSPRQGQAASVPARSLWSSGALDGCVGGCMHA